jgi:hypothetical protein
MRLKLREMMGTVLKTVFGTDEVCRRSTEIIASHTERKIDAMNAATERLASLTPASNVTEALQQLVGE